MTTHAAGNHSVGFLGTYFLCPVDLTYFILLLVQAMWCVFFSLRGQAQLSHCDVDTITLLIRASRIFSGGIMCLVFLWRQLASNGRCFALCLAQHYFCRVPFIGFSALWVSLLCTSHCADFPLVVLQRHTTYLQQHFTCTTMFHEFGAISLMGLMLLPSDEVEGFFYIVLGACFYGTVKYLLSFILRNVSAIGYYTKTIDLSAAVAPGPLASSCVRSLPHGSW